MRKWGQEFRSTADVFLDGAPAGTLDVYPDQDDVKLDEAVWHRFGLADTDHLLQLVVRGETFVDDEGRASQGTDIALTGLVVFRP